MHGIVLQLPLPQTLSLQLLRIVSTISPQKDVDRLNSVTSQSDTQVPCVAAAIEHMIDHYSIDVRGRTVAVISGSFLVRQPVVHVFTRLGATVKHASNIDTRVTLGADILACAIGIPKCLRKEHVGEDAIIFDVGISVGPSGSVEGDADLEDISVHAAKITPVPGGVGPVTVAVMLDNLYHCFISSNTFIKS